MYCKVIMSWDSEKSVWVATCNGITGLPLESGSYDALIEKVKIAIQEFMELENYYGIRTIYFLSERYDEVV